MSHTLAFDIRDLVLGTWVYRHKEFDKPLTAQETLALAAVREAIKALRINKENKHTMDMIAVRRRGEVARFLTGGLSRGLSCRDAANDCLLVWRHDAGLLLFLLHLKQNVNELYAIAGKVFNSVALKDPLPEHSPKWPSRRKVEISEDVYEEVHDCQECGSDKSSLSLYDGTWLCERCAEYAGHIVDLHPRSIINACNSIHKLFRRSNPFCAHVGERPRAAVQRQANVHAGDCLCKGVSLCRRSLGLEAGRL